MTSVISHLLRAALLPAAVVGTLSTQPQAIAEEKGKPDFSKARQIIREEMMEKSIPSISVAVARRGDILWEEGFGWADRENRVPATERTMYFTASVVKSITAMALMILQERKQLELDRPANDYLGAAKLTSPAWNPSEATVRRIANHTAGLTTFNPRNRLSIDEKIRRYGVLFWPPGDHFDYSNLGPQILEDIVARVSGKSYADFVRTEIFSPLGMNRASVGIDPGLQKYAAQRYSSEHGLRPPVDGGLYCSAHDLVRFGMFCLTTHLPDQKAIVPDAAIDAMHGSPVSTGDGSYSLGWWIDNDLYGYRSVVAMGGTDADQARLRLIPSEGIAVAALSNTGSTSSKLVHEILSALLPIYGEKRAKASDAKKPKASGKAAPSQALVGTWKGIVKTYREEIPLAFTIAESGDVRARLGSRISTAVNANFDNQRLSGRMSGDLGVEDDTGPERYHLELHLYLRDRTLRGAVVTAPSPNLPFWVELKRE